MPSMIAGGHKKIPFDLKNEFLSFKMLLGDRNNVNLLLHQIEQPAFQTRLAAYFGANLFLVNLQNNNC
ncbi:hypothetical protein [Liquorilactobacillus satsumensis]|uniref:hypothetical protein n=1 Tax=Liquorilactobacillus satsumensis TaxID=259059 RepID=UPI0039E7F587